MRLNQKGIADLALFGVFVVLLVAIVAFTLWKTNQTDDTFGNTGANTGSQSNTPDLSTNNTQIVQSDSRETVNKFLSSAGVSAITEWVATPECGPTDEFYGTYSISNSDNTFSDSEAELVENYAKDNSYSIDYFGRSLESSNDSYTITKDNWQIAIIDNLESTPSIRVTITSLEEVPEDLAADRSRCG